MREILFRGKIDNLSPDTGKWVHGPYVPESSGGYIYNTMYRPHMVRIDPATVGQYTGLMDKNGTKIFEGDIVRYADGYLYQVKFGSYNTNPEGCAAEYIVGWYVEFIRHPKYAMRPHEDKFVEINGVAARFPKHCLANEDNWKSLCFEVVGNIHDNPELLKGGASE